MAAGPVAGHARVRSGRHHCRYGGGHLPGRRQVRGRTPVIGGAAEQGQLGRATAPAQDAQGTTVTSSALLLAGVLAAEGSGDGVQAPGIGEIYPVPLATFSILGIPFEITRITLRL